MILYEYPFNERIRTLLRLEDLFERFTFFLTQEDPREHHVALITLFEIAEVAGRTDLKADLMKELERQRQTLAPFRGNPGIEQEALEAVLGEIEQTLAGLADMHGKTGQHLADNEWLASIRSRTIIPGGTCKFDLPSYYAWQQLPVEERRQEIAKWVMPMLALRDAAAIVLRLARESGQASKVMAMQGSYQQMLSGRTYQLMQVRVSQEVRMIPEASANKYMLWVRFTVQDGDLKPRAVDVDVPFHLTLCSL
ncbi:MULTISPECIES: cell division protein ZapD [unclassified Caballeronia]|uniref:cell division protein ZapD n=1 Tax=unclassified Caballeronia TaxID=2646786 RepID=UPI002857287A|nr:MULTISPECIES: cell division protein ZapD [unclassified Caballeronia]MDR5772574.1 cell division protein ZapD [Caballeronia sp. LZ002]MDR5848008.1 cell division protein ZapD [Caballeronia sp. LZ003]